MAGESSIKKAEKKKRIGAGMMIIGVVMIFASAAIAIVLEAPFTAAMLTFFKLPESYLPGPDFLIYPHLIFPSTIRLGITLFLFLVFVAMSYAVIAALAGHDPEGPEAMKTVMGNIEARKLYNRTKAKRRF